MADVKLEGYVRGIPPHTTEVVTAGYVARKLTNAGPGSAVVDGVVVRPGGVWTPQSLGQTKIVVSTLDEPAKVSVG